MTPPSINAAEIQRVLVVGAGESGVQIAIQFARFGFEPTILDVTQDRVQFGQRRQQELLESLVESALVASDQVSAIHERIRYSSELSTACRGTQLVCECVNEDIAVKRKLFAELNAACGADAIFTTNTSYLLPSSLAHASGRSDRLASLHFHVPVWFANAVDIMPHPRTSPAVVDVLVTIAERIGQVPIVLRRENPGYVFNAILHPLLMSGLDLAARDVTDFQTVDRSWMAITKMPIGPFGIVDKIGLDTVFKIVEQWAAIAGNKQATRVMRLLETYTADDRLGEKKQAGFYDYPNPAYRSEQFLKTSNPDAVNQSTSTQIDASHSASDEGTRAGQTEAWVPGEAAAPVSAKLKFELQHAGRAIVVGKNADVEVFQAAWCGVGGTLVSPPAAMLIGDTPFDEIDSWIESQFAVEPCTTFVVLQGLVDNLGSETNLSAGESPVANSILGLLQAWYRRLTQLDRLNDADLLTVSRDHPSSQVSYDGIVKGLLMESMAVDGIGLTARAIHLSADLPAQESTARVLTELAIARRERITGRIDECRRRQADAIVTLGAQQRTLRRYRRAEMSTTSSPAPSGTWLVTGGAKGIGLQVALRLAKRYSLRLCILGRTQLPKEDYLNWSQERLGEFKAQVMRDAYHRGQKPNQAWATHERGIELLKGLAEYRDAGIEVEYCGCDVGDAVQVRHLIEQQVANHGPIDGALHAAGVEQTAKFETKSESIMRATIEPKVRGTLALQEALASALPNWFIAFGSLAGQLGGVGQVDYVLANDQMAKLMRQWNHFHPSVRCVTMHWPGWDEVGMAARPSSKFMLERLNHQLMPVEEGMDHFFNVFENGPQDVDLIICRESELGTEFLLDESKH